MYVNVWSVMAVSHYGAYISLLAIRYLQELLTGCQNRAFPATYLNVHIAVIGLTAQGADSAAIMLSWQL